MRTFTDKNDQTFTLYTEVLEHILSGHPEIAEHLDLIDSTLKNPNFIYRSRIYENRFLYYRSYRKNLYSVVVVDISTKVIKTVYITDRIKKGELVWKKED